MPKFNVFIESVYEERYVVEAADEEEAKSKVLHGDGNFEETYEWVRFGELKEVEEIKHA